MGKKMRMKYGWLVVVLAILFICGCQASVTTANFQDLATASEVDSETQEPITETQVFAVDTPVIYVTGRVENAPEATVIKASWIYLDLDPEYLIEEAELTLEEVSSAIAFSLSKPDNGWPAGEYKVELYIDNDLAETVTFTVE